MNKELKLRLQDGKDLTLLYGAINLMQSVMIDKDVKLSFECKNTELIKYWHEETIDEWTRLQMIKKQIFPTQKGDEERK